MTSSVRPEATLRGCWRVLPVIAATHGKAGQCGAVLQVLHGGMMNRCVEGKIKGRV